MISRFILLSEPQTLRVVCLRQNPWRQFRTLWWWRHELTRRQRTDLASVYVYTTQNLFLLKREKLNAKYLKTCMKFVIFYSLPKKLCSITSLSKQLTKQSENHEPSWRTKTWRASFLYSSCRTWFIKIIGEEGKEKLSDFYWQSQNCSSAHILAIIRMITKMGPFV